MSDFNFKFGPTGFTKEDLNRMRREFFDAWGEEAPKPTGLDPMCEVRRLGVLCMVMRSHGWKMRLQEFPRAFPTRMIRCDVLRPDGTGSYAFGDSHKAALENVVNLVADEVNAL